MPVKLLSIVLLTSMLISCFSNTKKVKVVVIEKSSNQQNTSKTLVNEPITANIPLAQDRLIPVSGDIVQYFSKQHPGLSFNTIQGQAVRAFRGGVVIYSDSGVKSQGNMITIKHPLGFYTSYAQNQRLDVSVGDQVKLGQVIALSSETPLYFEMKKFKTRINPLKYLQKTP